MVLKLQSGHLPLRQHPHSPPEPGLESTPYVPGAIQVTLQILIHRVLTMALLCQYYFHFYFIAKETVAQEDYVTCPRSHNEVDFNSGPGV